jgi:ATP-dependent Lon protease
MSNQKILTLDNLSLQEINTDAELIPLLTPEDEEEMNKEELPLDLPISGCGNSYYSR